jgi:lipopolysaccharide biosynthesis glycosyltransferase
MSEKNITIEFVDITQQMEDLQGKLPIRDYYSKTTYYRLFVPKMFPEYDKIIYLDSDIIVKGDISEFFEYELGDAYVGAANDQLIQQIDVFGEYAEQVLGISRNAYFNAGVLLMNCHALRANDFLGKFIELLNTYTFVVAQDQDYLNVICRDRVKWIPIKWNLEASSEVSLPEEEICLIHYNMAAKPWNNEECCLGGYFWKYAEKTSVYEEIKKGLDEYTPEEQEIDADTTEQLFEMCRREILREDNYIKVQNRMSGKSPERLEILEKISRLEREGRFDIDVEPDPPAKKLMPEDVDYLRKKTRSKIKTMFAYSVARRFMNYMVDSRQLIIKDIIGIENYKNLDSGAVVTCNHFNAFDSFAMQITYEASKHRRRKLYRVINEGNYTSFPGFYGMLMRNCNTLPLSSSHETMKNFMNAVDAVLQKGHFVLVYPEQSMWWNYRKPKPLKRGAFDFAAKNNVPVLPIFITMEDSDVKDRDGFFVQEYTVHVCEPIYPDAAKSKRENAMMMMEENARVWKEVYEEAYQMPLEYTCDLEKAE